MQSDARINEIDPNSYIGNNDEINFELIADIEKELLESPCDLISLVFLLYNDPHTALQRLTVYQRISKDTSSTNPNMLHEWFRHAKSTLNWKHELVEALLSCQLYSIIRKLGINVLVAKQYYQTDNFNVNSFINPAKSALYKLCDTMNEENFMKLKKSLLTFDMDTTEYETCELLLLKLLSEKFITINQFQYNKKVMGFRVQLDKLIVIIEKLPGLRKFSYQLNALQQQINDDPKPTVPFMSTPTKSLKVDESNSDESTKQSENNANDFDDVYKMLRELDFEDNPNEMKADRTKLEHDSYEIKSVHRVGICAIINQENFYPSKNSIEITGQINSLDNRAGSEKDKIILEQTMRSLNFEVITENNLDHKAIFKFVKEVIKYKVTREDSIFMLCILSHGTRGHVYAADSVKVKMDDIQNLLDSEDGVNLHNKPKLLIVQACQVDDPPPTSLVADTPSYSYNLKKTNFLIYWATAPELEAYRDEKKGSIFIQLLCRTIHKFSDRDVLDIFTKVTNNVTLLCNKLKCAQVPIFQSTLRKKLYLKIPQ